MATTTAQRITLPGHGVLATEIVHSPGFSMPLQTDTHHEVFHLVRGKCLLFLGSKEYACQLAPGDYCVVPAGTPHRLQDVNPATLFLLCLSPEFLDAQPDRREVWGALSRGNIRPDDSVSRRLVSHWRSLLALHRAVETARTRLEVILHADAFLLLLDEARGCPTHADSRARVMAFRTHLLAAPFEHWTVERAARFCGLSVRRFSGLYSQAYGTTIVRDLQKIRIEMACELLSSGMHSIPGAAYTAGFEDLSHFYRVFRAQKGVPPGQWFREKRNP